MVRKLRQLLLKLFDLRAHSTHFEQGLLSYH
jgi:hypothetical protein